MTDAKAPHDDHRSFRSLPLAQREVALLIVLSVIAAALFAGTHRLAVWSHDRRVLAANYWFARGQQLAEAGDLDAGIAALREAVATDRQNPRFELALAHWLTDADRPDEARQILLQLRQGEPDDVEVNYRLARLVSPTGETADAVRYYNDAMYGLARIGADYDRRQIRTDLIAFLLDRGDRAEARTELVALGRELPDDAATQLQAAHLADRAGDTALSLEHYLKAGAAAPKSVEAATGAGEAAFATYDFALAVRELERAITVGAQASAIEPHLTIAKLVLATDPLVPRVGTAEGVRRVIAGLSRAADRDDTCMHTTNGPPPPSDSARVDLDQLRHSSKSALEDVDTVTRAVKTIGAIEANVTSHCPSLLEPIDQAWRLIATIHQGGRR